MAKNKDPQGKKWLLVINNPADKGFTHERITSELGKLKSTVYWCMSDEKGNEEETPHTHIFVAFSSAVRFSTLKNLFPPAHLERANGTAQENRDYIAKDGKWKGTEKESTIVDGSFREFGEMPLEQRRNGSGIEAVILDKIWNGSTNTEILVDFPELFTQLRNIDYARQSYLEEEFRNKNRDITVTYVTGPTGVGKSYNIMNDKNLGDKCRVTDYTNPWDFYLGQSTIILEEFHSSLKIGEMLNILDIFPLVLRARYSNRVAMFDKIFIVSNLSLMEQYKDVQDKQPHVFQAFLRRIHKVVIYTAFQEYQEYSLKEYLTSMGRGISWIELTPGIPTPCFDNRVD